MTTQRQKRPSVGAVVGVLVPLAALLMPRAAEPQAAVVRGAGLRALVPTTPSGAP
ncbi:MAG: hypothetical protein AB2L07_05205 [Thermoanaerobaculaceae bacterium]